MRGAESTRVCRVMCGVKRELMLGAACLIDPCAELPREDDGRRFFV